MGIEFTPWGLIGLVTAIIAWSAAWFVWTQVPDRRIAHRFALLLVLEGVMIITSYASPVNWLTDLPTVVALSNLHVVNDSLLIAIYLPTIAVVVDSRMARFFGSMPGILIPLGVGLTGAVLTMAAPELFTGDPDTIGSAIEGVIPFIQTEFGPLWPYVFIGLAISYTYGLIATIRAWLKASTPVSKRKNGILALAFGVRDVFWGTMFLYSAVLLLFAPEEFDIMQAVVSLHIAAAALIVYIALTVYGIASAQLFDIDLKVKWTLQRGTVAAAYVAFYFVASEGTAAFLSDQVGTVVGLIVTGLLLFALTPIHNLAVKLSDTALPQVQTTPEYLNFKKLEIYAEAFADTTRNGTVSAAGRAALNRLREQLELNADDASSLEAEMATAGVSTPTEN